MYLQHILFIVIINIIYTQTILINSTHIQVIGWSEIQHISKYTEYGSSGIIHFIIPDDTEYLSFVLQAVTRKVSFMFDCQVFDITVHFKQGSLPVVSPEGAPFPSTFVNITRPSVYNLEFQANQTKHYINITSPLPGNWFGIAFRSWTDPQKDKIEQQGLVPVCECSLMTKAVIIKRNITTIDFNKDIDISIPPCDNYSQTFKLYTDESVEKIMINLQLQSTCKWCNPILIALSIRYVPSKSNYSERIVLEHDNYNKTTLDLVPEENSWHYIEVKYVFAEESKFCKTNLTYSNTSRINLSFNVVRTLYSRTGSIDHESQIDNITDNEQHENSKRSELFSNIKRIGTDSESNSNSLNSTIRSEQTLQNNTNKLKQIYDKIVKKTFYFKSGENISYDQYKLLKLATGNSFAFTYILEPNSNQQIPKLINLTSQFTVFKFDVNGLEDIGGTIYVGFSLGPKKNFKNNQETVNKTTNYIALICIRRNAPEFPSLPNKCIFNNITNNASIILNSTSPLGTYENVHIPFPEIGTWFISVGLFPLTNNTFIPLKETNCSYSCINFYNSCTRNCFFEDYYCHEKCSDTIKNELTCQFCNGENYVNGSIDETEIKAWNASIIFSLTMSPCVDESCGQFGQCNMYIGSGILLSACRCRYGYTGWDCSYAAFVTPPGIILLSTLLLTLSNLLFLVSIYFACHRKYWTEAVVYTFTMLFSIFYHACDSGEDIYTFCLFKRRVLEFCDFYSGLLSIWVTLVAMANINQKLVSVLHMVGAILLAFGTEYNKQGVLVFLLPSITGLALISVSWGLKCRDTKQCFPARKYLLIYFPIGMILVFIGLICFAFLETNSNYKYVHSSWHMIMAISILCLLPSDNSFFPKS